MHSGVKQGTSRAQSRPSSADPKAAGKDSAMSQRSGAPPAKAPSQRPQHPDLAAVSTEIPASSSSRVDDAASRAGIESQQQREHVAPRQPMGEAASSGTLHPLLEPTEPASAMGPESPRQQAETSPRTAAGDSLRRSLADSTGGAVSGGNAGVGEGRPGHDSGSSAHHSDAPASQGVSASKAGGSGAESSKREQNGQAKAHDAGHTNTSLAHQPAPTSLDPPKSTGADQADELSLNEGISPRAERQKAQEQPEEGATKAAVRAEDPATSNEPTSHKEAPPPEDPEGSHHAAAIVSTALSGNSRSSNTGDSTDDAVATAVDELASALSGSKTQTDLGSSRIDSLDDKAHQSGTRGISANGSEEISKEMLPLGVHDHEEEPAAAELEPTTPAPTDMPGRNQQ